MNAKPDLDVLLNGTELWPGERERLLRAGGLASRSCAPALRRELLLLLGRVLLLLLAFAIDTLSKG